MLISGKDRAMPNPDPFDYAQGRQILTDATPRPWVQRGRLIILPDGDWLAACDTAGDAALIVRAVNNHERLVAALELIAECKGKTLIGDDFVQGQPSLYSNGANAAFEDCAGTASDALDSL